MSGMNKSDFRSFYERHADRIYRFVLLRVGSVSVAEDLTSDIFVKALAAFGSYDSAKSDMAWIYTIARNTLANYWRDNAKAAQDVDAFDLPIAGNDFLSGVLREEDRLFLQRALQALSAEDRQLIEWKYLQGYKHEEIATFLGKSVSAIKVATHRAMKELKIACSKI